LERFVLIVRANVSHILLGAKGDIEMLRKGLMLFLGATVISLIATAPLHAAVIILEDPGTTYTADMLTGFATNGDMMVGMEVTAFFFDGTSETLAWQALGPGQGGVVTSAKGWTLRMSGDTFEDDWMLTASSDFALSGLSLFGAPGKTVFDRTFGGAVGTDGSALGLDFMVTGGTPGDITATYRDQFALTGFAPVGDLFVSLDIDFAQNFSGRMMYMADTDNATTIPVVPAPGTLLLLGAGALALGFRKRKAN
jgi:hypothetical protein